MTGGVAGMQPIPGVNPMIALQRRAFGFGGSATTAQLALAVIGPIAAMLICWGRVHGLVIAAAVLIPTPMLLALQAFRERANWTAQDVLAWLDREAAGEWHDATGTAMPRNSAAAVAWLAAHVEGSVPADCWAAALLMAGRVNEGRERVGRLPEDTPARVHRRLDLQLAADSSDGRVVDGEEADDAVRDDPNATTATRAAHLAYHASVAAVSRGADGLTALASARPAIGRLPVRLTLRLLVIRFRFAAISALFGAWLLVAVLVGLATSGGVVWF